MMGDPDIFADYFMIAVVTLVLAAAFLVALTPFTQSRGADYIDNQALDRYMESVMFQASKHRRPYAPPQYDMSNLCNVLDSCCLR